MWGVASGFKKRGESAVMVGVDKGNGRDCFGCSNLEGL